MLTVGDRFPMFTLTGVYGVVDDYQFSAVSAANFRNQWSVVIGYPEDFTFVCPTELLGYNDLYHEFMALGATLYGLSTDKPHSHLGWRISRKDLGAIKYAWLADTDHALSYKLGILISGRCMRATFIVDPVLIIRHVTINDENIGRNPKETLRVLGALRTEKRTPCGWKQGEPTL